MVQHIATILQEMRPASANTSTFLHHFMNPTELHKGERITIYRNVYRDMKGEHGVGPRIYLTEQEAFDAPKEWGQFFNVMTYVYTISYEVTKHNPETWATIIYSSTRRA